MKSVLLKILGVLVSFIIAFGIAEIAVRTFAPHQVAPVRFAYDPQLGEIPTPGQQGRKIIPGVFDHTYSNDSLGFRGRKEYRLEKTTDFRILFLGDSFTYGLGVNDDQTFAYLVEQQLLKNHLSVEVINAGNPGRGTDYALRFFQVRGIKFRPDLTVVCFLANDFVDNERGDYFRVAENGELITKSLGGSRKFLKNLLINLPGYNWLVSWSQAVNLVKDGAVKLLLKTADPNSLRQGGLVIQYPDIDTGYANDHRKRLAEIYLKNLLQAVKATGGDFMIFYIPISQEVERFRKSHIGFNEETAINEIVKAQGEVLWSLTPAMADSGEPVEKLYFKEDGHWTALGHALAARYMSEKINERLAHRRD